MIGVIEKALERFPQIGHRFICAVTISLDIQLNAVGDENTLGVFGYGVIEIFCHGNWGRQSTACGAIG